MLDNGTIIRVPPDIGTQYGAWLQVGQSIAANGYGTENQFRRCFQATAIGLSGQPLTPIYGAAGPAGPPPIGGLSAPDPTMKQTEINAGRFNQSRNSKREARMKTILLLIISNTFMTLAWYGHLKFREKPLWLMISGRVGGSRCSNIDFSGSGESHRFLSLHRHTIKGDAGVHPLSLFSASSLFGSFSELRSSGIISFPMR